MMNKKRVLFWSKLFLILVLTGNITLTAQDGAGAKSGGCGGSSKNKTNVSKADVSNASANDLDSRRWNLIEMNGAKVESSKAFIEFVAAEKRFAGNAGCNRMFGKFEIDGDKIKLSGIGATKILCSQESVMQLETDFIKALEQTTRFEKAGDALNLYAGNLLILKFSGAAKNASGNQNTNVVKNENSNILQPEDKKWILTSIAGKPAAKLEKEPFLVFDKQKASAGGDTSCNSFGGSYQTDGSKTATVNTAANTAGSSVNSNAAKTTDAGLNLLESSIGKTASDIKLWENGEMSGRLGKLMGADYAAMKKYWQTQTPIEAEEKVLSLSGCEDNNCGGNQYVMFVDTANNNINVYHFKNGEMKAYKKKGDIALPKNLAGDFETTKKNAKPQK